MKTGYMIAAVSAAMLLAGCSDFLNRLPLTSPSSDTYLSTESQVLSYVNGLYAALPSLTQYGSGVRAADKNSDNIVSEKYDQRINGELSEFDGYAAWSSGYQNLRDVNYFLHYYQVPAEMENADVRSLYAEVLFLRAWWHFDLLKKFGSVPVMDGFWDGNATLEGLQIPAAPRKEVALFILDDLDKAIDGLHRRNRFSGLRINKEAALVLAMNVSLYEGSWEKYHSGDVFAAEDADPGLFFGKVLSYGDILFDLMPVSEGLNTVYNDPFGALDGGEAYAHLFNQKDLSAVSEALFWKKYDVSQGVQHSLTSLLASGVVDNEAAAGITRSLVDAYLYADGTFIDPSDPDFKDFNRTFAGRDRRLYETVMSDGHKFRSTSISRPMKVAEYVSGDSDEARRHNASLNPPRLLGDGNSRNLTGYHTALGVDTTYVSSSFWDTGLVIVRYAEALLAYAEAAEETGQCTDDVLSSTLKPLRERAGVLWKEPVPDPAFTDYGYPLTPVMQEIRRERRCELALQGFRLDDILRWRGHKVIAGKRGCGAYLGEDGVLYKAFNMDDPAVREAFGHIPVDASGHIDPLRDRLPSGYGFVPDRDYLLPIPPEEVSLVESLEQNPNW
ncbi:MAG: RagB/SusD family nutrient uptake outer membrane protein [Bacteroidales bacterium]|nr:RagB/SusD family nutrient uptake outer membrane protein [Bacteroidales bacterium]